MHLALLGLATALLLSQLASSAPSRIFKVSRKPCFDLVSSHEARRRLLTLASRKCTRDSTMCSSVGITAEISHTSPRTTPRVETITTMNCSRHQLLLLEASTQRYRSAMGVGTPLLRWWPRRWQRSRLRARLNCSFATVTRTASVTSSTVDSTPPMRH